MLARDGTGPRRVRKAGSMTPRNYVWRDSSVRELAHAYETAPSVDDVSACGTGGLPATTDGASRYAHCAWCARIAHHGTAMERDAERQRRAEYERRRWRRAQGVRP